MLLGMRQVMLDNGDDLVKIWASEYGLPTSLDPDQEQAYQDQLDFIRDFLNVWGNGLTDAQLKQLPAKYRELAATWKDWIGPAFIYSLRDRLGKEATEQGSFGLFYFDEVTGEWKMKPAAEFIKDLIGKPPVVGDPAGGGDLAAALAASLQKLVQSVALAVQNAVSAVHNAVQAVQQAGAQIGNALAKAIAAWAASIKKTPTPTLTAAAVEAVDTAALAQSAVDESVDSSAATSSAATTGADLAGSATERIRAADKHATETAAADPAVGSEPASPETPKATTLTDDATGTSAADTSTEELAADASKTPDEPVAANDQKTTDDSKTRKPANRKDEDEVKGDAKKDDDKKSDGDKHAGGATATGKHAKGTVKNGTSVDDIKTKVGDRAAKKSSTAKHAAATAAD